MHCYLSGRLTQTLSALLFTEETSPRDEKSRLYRPTSKLAELAASFKSSRDVKDEKSHKEQRERDRERESRFEPRVVRNILFFVDGCDMFVCVRGTGRKG